MENKKIKNATSFEYDGIQFKSMLEAATYKLLQEAGLNPQYEQQTFQIWKGKKFLVPCYDLHKDRKLHKTVWGINSYKPTVVRYTPDFIVTIMDSMGCEKVVFIECKGFENDVYPYKKKLFRSYLEDNCPNSLFFEVHNQKQVKQAIEVINQWKEKV